MIASSAVLLFALVVFVVCAPYVTGWGLIGLGALVVWAFAEFAHTWAHTWFR